MDADRHSLTANHEVDVAAGRMPGEGSESGRGEDAKDATAASSRPDSRRSLCHRLALAARPLLLAAIIAARAAGLRESYENDGLRLVLSFTFYTLVSLGTLFLIGRSFLASGSPGLLLLECGVVLWSLAGTVGDVVYHGDANINVTIFNTGILLAGLCHLAGAILSLRPQRSLRAKPLGWGRAARSPWARWGWSPGRRWRAGCRSSSSRARVARRCATGC